MSIKIRMFNRNGETCIEVEGGKVKIKKKKANVTVTIKTSRQHPAGRHYPLLHPMA